MWNEESVSGGGGGSPGLKGGTLPGPLAAVADTGLQRFAKRAGTCLHVRPKRTEK